MDDEIAEALAATRSVVKSTARSLRTCLSFLADLEERLDERERLHQPTAQPRRHSDEEFTQQKRLVE